MTNGQGVPGSQASHATVKSLATLPSGVLSSGQSMPARRKRRLACNPKPRSMRESTVKCPHLELEECQSLDTGTWGGPHLLDVLKGPCLWYAESMDNSERPRCKCHNEPMVGPAGWRCRVKSNAKCVRWARLNREQKRESDRRYYQANQDRIKAQVRRYQQDNPDKVKASKARALTNRLSRISRSYDPDDCWLWDGATDSRGYGRYFGAKHPHAAAFEFWVRPLEPGEHIHHTCRTKACFNPRHLEPMTASKHSHLHNSERQL